MVAHLALMQCGTQTQERGSRPFLTDLAMTNQDMTP
jgi:hypothetical protein